MAVSGAADISRIDDQVTQVTTSEARSCLRADFRRFWRRVVHLKTITQQDAGAKTEDLSEQVRCGRQKERQWRLHD